MIGIQRMAERVGFPAALILMGVSIGPCCKFPFLQCYWQIVALVRVAVTVADRGSEVNRKISGPYEISCHPFAVAVAAATARDAPL